jgi:hypothetical protein
MQIPRRSSRGGLGGIFPGRIGFLILFLFGCGDDGNGPPGAIRFGQIGEVRVRLDVPLPFNSVNGLLRQALSWNSGGTWQIEESITYRGLRGDHSLKRSEGDPAEYAYLVTQLNDAPGLRLFDDLVPELPGECPLGATMVYFTMRDEPRDEEVTWVRCSTGSLATLRTADAGPDDDAVRVIQSAILLRDFTEGRDFVSAYNGSVPFGTLDRTEDSGARLEEPIAFYDESGSGGNPPDGWIEFWRAHTNNPNAFPPSVDWAREIVHVAAVGKREEAGDSVEIRRVLQTGDGTQVTLFERIPGDFCSPAAKEHYPVHVVVAPRTLLPVRFSDLVPERVPCGF